VSRETDSFRRGLDQTDRIVSTIGLALTASVGLAGLLGLLYVAFHVTRTSPPSFGSQGEWLYAALACVLVAGWGLARASTFYARIRRAEMRIQYSAIPELETRPDASSIKTGGAHTQDTGEAKPSAWKWSLETHASPQKTVDLTEPQLAAADAMAGPGVDWDAVSRQVNPDYASWSAFERTLFRQALQRSIELRRRGHGT
jgi:hypothetical protein